MRQGRIMAATAASAEVRMPLIVKGLYEKKRWGIQKRGDDLRPSYDGSRIITRGGDRANPSGVAVDLRRPPGRSYELQRHGRSRSERQLKCSAALVNVVSPGEYDVLERATSHSREPNGKPGSGD